MRLNKFLKDIISTQVATRFKKSFFSSVTICLVATQLMSCGIYSFTGTTLSPDIKNISVANFINNAGGGPANISQQLTEKVKEYYQQNSTLKIADPDANADLQLEGTIVGYDVTPIAPTAPTAGQQTQLASLNRLTIRVQVRFTNTKNEQENFDAPFSFYADFPQERTLTQVENELVNTIFDQIVFDIFNKSVANW
jgi:hypothetical protein